MTVYHMSLALGQYADVADTVGLLAAFFRIYTMLEITAVSVSPAKCTAISVSMP